MTGDEFFRTLVKAMGELLGMRRVFLGELRGTRIRPLAAWRDETGGVPSGLYDMPEYELEGTACADLLGTRLPLRALDLGARFPDRADLVGLAQIGAAVHSGEGDALGVLCALGDQAVVVATHAEIFSLFAERAAAEVERSRAEQEFRARTEARLRYQSALVELARLRTTTLEAALRTVLPVAARTLGVGRASYWALDDDDEGIVCVLHYTAADGRFTQGTRLVSTAYPAYFKALRQWKVIDASDAPNDPRTYEFRTPYYDELRIGAVLDVPVSQAGRLVGVLCFGHLGGPRTWTPEEQDFATPIAASISIALEASARARAEERYALVSQATGEAVWEWDPRTDRVSWNDALRTTFLYDVDLEIKDGFHWWAARLHPDDRARVERAVQDGIATGQTRWSNEYRFARGDGSFAYVLARGVAAFDDEGRLVRMAGSMQDVTARKALEHRVLLADRMASMGTLAAGVAHEINNPLAYVKGNLDYVIEKLSAETTIDPEVVLALEDARVGAVRMREIVRDLKMFSRADFEAKGPVDVEAVVKGSIAMAWNEIRHRAKLVRREGHPPPVLATQARLGQVILNLLVNAAQAIPESATQSNEIRVETGVAADGRVFIEVADTGPGISCEVQRRMFDPFYTTKAIGEGTGLGLAICHSIVTELGGEIVVESESGRGATFRVLLPAAAPVAAVEPRPVAAAHEARRARVLVVDDDPSVAITVKRILGRDHEVVVSSGGGEALARLRADPSFDVVVCDVMMPDVSGMDVYGELERHLPHLTSKVVFMTGGAFTPLARDFLATTSRPCIEKPFDPDDLRRAVAAMLS